jgi:rhamnulokinase
VLFRSDIKAQGFGAMNTHSYCAIDLGAGSGRVMLGTLARGRLTLEEIHRFPSEIRSRGGRLYWDIEALFTEIVTGLSRCREAGVAPESIGVDSWGVDFGLLNADGAFIQPPYAYRDPSNVTAFNEFLLSFPREKIYELTGIQLMPINTLFQLQAMKKGSPEVFEKAKKLIFIPDIFNYFLTGETKTEFTFATTSQLFNPVTRRWEETLFKQVGISPALMQQVVQPLATIGRLTEKMQIRTGLGPVPVVAVGSHDTASAVAAVPAEGNSWAYISSGTWSLMGIETRDPIINHKAFIGNFTNEGGVANTFRFLKNITGMWILAECKRIWARERAYSFEELTAGYASGKPFSALIDPDWEGFLSPADMPQAIREYCSKTSQSQPQEHADFVRIIFESLALKYRYVLEQLRALSSLPVEAIHIVGGGSQNAVLCQCAADATGLPVHAGPVEATAIGNILLQAMAQGHCTSIAELRSIVRASFAVKSYFPQDKAVWEEAYKRFKILVEG